MISHNVTMTTLLLLLSTDAAAVGGDDAESPPEYTWVEVTSRAAFAARDGAGALTHNGKIWLLAAGTRATKRTFR